MNNAITVFQSSCSEQDHDNITQITQHLFRIMKNNNCGFISNIVNVRNEHMLEGSDWKYNKMYNDVHIANEIKKIGKKTTMSKKLSPLFIERLDGSGDNCITLLKYINCFALVNLIKKAIKKINKQDTEKRNQIYKEIISSMSEEEDIKKKMAFLCKYFANVIQNNNSNTEDIINYFMIDVLHELTDDEYSYVLSVFHVYTI